MSEAIRSLKLSDFPGENISKATWRLGVGSWLPVLQTTNKTDPAYSYFFLSR
jgi:hypothetical protein